MSKEDKPFKLQIAITAQVLALAAPKRQFAQAQIEGVARWLDEKLQSAIKRRDAIKRGDAEALTMGDVRKLERAYLRFHNIIANLQGRDDPPPELPSSESGSTVWDSWIGANIAFGFPQGCPHSIDWRLIAAMLALYETVSGKPPSGAQWDGPTMKFLKKAMALLAEGEHKFTLPSADALRKQLPKLRQSYLVWEQQTLSEIISKTGE